MIRIFIAISIVLGMIAPFSPAYGAGSPVMVTHILTGYDSGTAGVTLHYTLQVVNLQDVPLFDVSLSLVPRPPLLTQKATVTVGSLAPHQSREISIHLQTQTQADANQFAQNQLLWAGAYFDSERKPVEFPVTSRPGGAR